MQFDGRYDVRKRILLELVQRLAEIVSLTFEDGGSGENKMTVTRVERVARFIEIQNVQLRPPSNKKKKKRLMAEAWTA